jgi:hypothetical protein
VANGAVCFVHEAAEMHTACSADEVQPLIDGDSGGRGRGGEQGLWCAWVKEMR